MKANHQMTSWLAALLGLTLAGGVRADSQISKPPRALELAQAARYDRQAQHQTGDSKRKDTAAATTEPTKFNKASALIGMEVRNHQGEKLGDIKDIVIDLDGGKVSYVVMSSGGVLGIGDKLLAVPLTAFTRDLSRHCLLLMASKDNISRAEGIGENWPTVQEPSFGAMPFWQKPSEKPESPDTTQPRQPEK